MRSDDEFGPFAALCNARFLELWRDVNLREIGWAEFEGMEMPQGASARQTWAAIQSLRLNAGMTVGSDRDSAAELWFNLPQTDFEAVWEVTARVKADSPLDRYVRSRPYRTVDIGSQVAEAAEALAQDGVDAGYEAVRAVLVEGALGFREFETVLRNYQAILDEEAKGSQPMRTSVEGLYCALLRGCEGEQHDLTAVWDRRSFLNMERALSRTPSLNSSVAICTSLYMQYGASDFLGVRCYPMLFGSLLRRVVFIRSGMPALSVLPLTRLRGSSANFSPGAGGDLTACVSAFVHEMSKMLDRLEATVREEQRSLEALREAVARSPLFNERQRQILSCALIGPCSFDYEDIVDRFGVSYNTARADLGGLVNQGLLYTTNEARKLTFVPVPNIAAALGRKILPQ